MAGPLAASTRWLLGAAAVVALIAVAGVVAGGGGRDAADLEEGSPAAVVRDLLQALEDRDPDAMRATLAPGLRGACTDAELRRRAREERRTEQRVTLVGTEELDGTAEVEVRRTEHRGEPPFGGPDHERTEVFELARRDGRWAITHVPWSHHACPEWAR